MRKLWLLAAVSILVLSVSSCSDGDKPPSNEDITSPPSSFTKKVLIELFNSESSSSSPDGDNGVQDIINDNTGRVYSASVHGNDPFEIGQHDALSNHLGGIPGYPRSAIDRVPAEENSSQTGEIVYSRGLWPVNADLRLQEQVDVGLALSTELNGGTASIDVYVASKAAVPGDVRLTVYLIENNVKAQNQLGTNGTYYHQRVLRRVISSSLGDPLDLGEATGPFIRTYGNIDVSSYKTDHLYVIAFVNRVGANTESHEIYNVQQVKLGFRKNWN